jgi:hypothetical protein
VEGGGISFWIEYKSLLCACLQDIGQEDYGQVGA